MKREYVKPSMAMDLFENVDMTNVTVLSTVAYKKGAKPADRYGMSILDLKS